MRSVSCFPLHCSSSTEVSSLSTGATAACKPLLITVRPISFFLHSCLPVMHYVECLPVMHYVECLPVMHYVECLPVMHYVECLPVMHYVECLPVMHYVECLPVMHYVECLPVMHYVECLPVMHYVECLPVMHYVECLPVMHYVECLPVMHYVECLPVMHYVECLPVIPHIISCWILSQTWCDSDGDSDVKPGCKTHFFVHQKVRNCVVCPYYVYKYAWLTFLYHILFHMYVSFFIVWIVVNMCSCTRERTNEISCILYLANFLVTSVLIIYLPVHDLW